MNFSWWTHNFSYEGTVDLTVEETYQHLLRFYENSTKDFLITNELNDNKFKFQRGSKLMSALGLGSEKKCRHYIEIEIIKIEDQKSMINWSIDMKACGLQIGKNAIIEECKAIIIKA